MVGAPLPLPIFARDPKLPFPPPHVLLLQDVQHGLPVFGSVVRAAGRANVEEVKYARDLKVNQG